MLESLTTYWPAILGGLSLLVAIGAFVAKLTANKTDDTVFAFLGKLLGMIPKSDGKPTEVPGGSVSEPLLRERTDAKEEAEEPSTFRQPLDR